MDLSALRKKMVEEQLAGRGIHDVRVLDIFGRIQRHLFVPDDLVKSAYEDYPLSIGEEQTISQPYIVALMTEALELKGGESVLEIGTGSGFQTAILAELTAKVYSIERIAVLAQKAEKLLDELGYVNVEIKVGDGSLGWVEKAPFDRIIIAAACPRIPLPLGEQLSENGKLILPMGQIGNQVLTLVEKKNGKLESSPLCGCVFVPLVGKYGCKMSDD